MRKFLTAVALTSGYMLSTKSAHANSTSLGIYPPVTRITALPGAVIRTPITIINNSNTEVLTGIKLLGFKAANENNGSVEYYNPGTKTPNDIDSLIKEVKMYDGKNQIKSLKLYPKEYKNLILELTTPNNQKDYYFSVVFLTESEKSQNEEETTISVVQGIANHILLSVGPLQRPTARISEFSTASFSLGGTQSFQVEVDNTSSNFITTTGTVAIYNIFGKKVGEVKLLPGIILADSQRYATNSLGAKSQKVVWAENHTFGFYTAKAVIHVNKSKTITAETSFFSTPLMILIITTCLLFVSVSIFYRVIKKVNFRST